MKFGDVSVDFGHTEPSSIRNLPKRAHNVGGHPLSHQGVDRANIWLIDQERKLLVWLGSQLDCSSVKAYQFPRIGLLNTATCCEDCSSHSFLFVSWD